MKQCVLEEPGRLVVRDVRAPVPGPGGAVVRVRAALTCGTDLKAYRRGHPKMPCPTPFGHEVSGDIVALGDGVEGFEVGDAVMTANSGPCGQCFFCVRDQENLCGSLMDELLLGAYAEQVLLPARILGRNTFVKPDELSYEHAALLEPLSSVCLGLAHVRRRNLEGDATVLIMGAGPIAALWLLALRLSGDCRVVVAGRRRPRLDMLRALGAYRVLGAEDDLDEAVAELTDGRGADVVVECTGLPEVWEQASSHARMGGQVVLFGGCRSGSRVSFDCARLHYGGVSIASPFHFRPRDVAEARRLLAEPGAPWSGVVTSRASLDDVPAVFERLGDATELKCAILPGGLAETTGGEEKG